MNTHYDIQQSYREIPGSKSQTLPRETLPEAVHYWWIAITKSGDERPSEWLSLDNFIEMIVDGLSDTGPTLRVLDLAMMLKADGNRFSSAIGQQLEHHRTTICNDILERMSPVSTLEMYYTGNRYVVRLRNPITPTHD